MKTKIFCQNKDVEISHMILQWAGVILKPDEKKVEEFKIAENDVIELHSNLKRELTDIEGLLISYEPDLLGLGDDG